MEYSFINKNIPGSLLISTLVLFLIFNLVALIGASSLQAENFPLLRRGSEGDQVEKLQKDLNRLGFRIADDSGYFGLQTEIAVEQF